MKALLRFTLPLSLLAAASVSCGSKDDPATTCTEKQTSSMGLAGCDYAARSCSDGHEYALTCRSSDTPPCTCTIDSETKKTLDDLGATCGAGATATSLGTFLSEQCGFDVHTSSSSL